MSENLRALFPGLQTSSHSATSPADPKYNCIAWSAGDSANWWWPLGDAPEIVWPAGVPRELTVDAFRAAFEALGYLSCADDTVESGFEKIALFVDALGEPTHAARQLPSGRWTSKLGRAVDIEHDLRALEGAIYGKVALMLKRPLARLAS